MVHNPDVPPGNENVMDHIRVELVATFGGDDDNLDAVLSGWQAMTVSKDGQIVALDYQTNQLKSYDGHGRHLWTSLGPGQGPGEINNPGQPRFGFDGNIYLPNHSGNQLTVVSPNGAFERSIDMGILGLERPGFQGFLDDSHALFYKWVRGTHGGTVFTASTDGDWSLADSFTVQLPSLEPANPLLIMWLELAPLDGSIVIPNQFAFEQRVYAPDGQLFKTMIRDKDGLAGVKLIETERGYGQVQFSQQKAPWELDDNWLLVQSSWDNNWEAQAAYMKNPTGDSRPPSDRHESLDFYTRDWELVWSLDAAQIESLFPGGLYLADGQGHMYTYDSETGMGYKYQVRVR